MKSVLVTGSSGLVGSAVVSRFARRGFAVHGVDNNQRAVFLGPDADTSWNRRRLAERFPAFVDHELDIRDRAGVLAIVAEVRPAAIVHAAAQPSHDRASAIPFDDFDTNAVGHKGKQVRDNLHAEDVAGFVEAFVDAPRSAKVYNLGGGKQTSCSVLEAFALVQECTGQGQIHRHVDRARIGDHVCYYSDLSKIGRHFPRWEITRPLAATVREIVDSWKARLP